MARKEPRVSSYTTKGGLTLWRGFVYYPDDECPNPKQRYLKYGCPGHCKGLTGFTTEDEADEATKRRDAEITLGINLTPETGEGMTLNEVGDHFFAGSRPKKISARMMDQYRRNWEASIRETIGTLPVMEIGPLDVHNWIGDQGASHG